MSGSIRRTDASGREPDGKACRAGRHLAAQRCAFRDGRSSRACVVTAKPQEETMTRHRITTIALSMIAAALAAFAVPRTASADATCTALLTDKFNYLAAHDGYYNVEVTVTKDSLHYVTYSRGWVQLSGPWLSGPTNLQFSDRFSGIQNFNIAAIENTQIWIGSTGTLWIWNNNYSYYIVAGTDMSCAGGLITKYVPGLGVVTVAIRDWQWIG
jgi:hypothetical protein